jgi:cyclic beta-1,2-glucan synthetase
VYALPPHTGRGGWTWYTGSAGWMYRLILEALLGVELTADKLRIKPCLPAEWKAFRLHYRFRETLYRIEVTQASDAEREPAVRVDGALQADNAISLVDDHVPHDVEIVVRSSPAG